jgi:hypothetical protein
MVVDHTKINNDAASYGADYAKSTSGVKDEMLAMQARMVGEICRRNENRKVNRK